MTRLLIAGNPSWAQAFTLDAPYEIAQQAEFQGYMRRIIEERPALIIVDSQVEDWQTWITSPKVSPASRRIPILFLSDDADERADAPLYGADYMLSRAEFLGNALKFVADFAHSLDDETLAALESDCQAELPPLAQEGIQRFNAGEYYRQHDLFEEQWMATTRPVRDLYRAILQVGVGYYQIERGNYRGALKMLQRSVQWLMLLPDICQGVNIQKLREDSFRVRAELERLGEENFDKFDKGLIKGVELIKPD